MEIWGFLGSCMVGLTSLLGIIITNNTNSKKIQNDMKSHQELTDYKIEELTKEVKKHNDLDRRISVLEEVVKLYHEKER